jgi:hypothetical protein
MYEESWGFDCRTDQRRLLFAQGPTNTLSSVRSYFEGMMTGDRAFRLRARILEKKTVNLWRSTRQCHQLLTGFPPAFAVSWPNSLRLHLPKLHQRATSSTKEASHPRLFELLLRTCYGGPLMHAIECATDPKVFLYPCRGDPRSMHCQNYGFRFRQLATAVF